MKKQIVRLLREHQGEYASEWAALELRNITKEF